MRTFGISQARGRRSMPRTQAPSGALLSMSAGDYPATIIDISRTGARLRSEFLPNVGQQLSFSADDVHAVAEVVWCGAGNCAIEFDTPIAVSEVHKLRGLRVNFPV